MSFFFQQAPKPNLDHLKVIDYSNDMALPLEGLPALKILQEGCQQLCDKQIHHWISSGTLIGLYRDKKLIPFDTDLDVNVLMDVKHPVTIKLKGFKPVRSMFYDDLPMQTAYIKEKVIFDIYYFYTGIQRGKAINYNDHGIIKKPMKFIEKLSTLEHENVCYPIPNHVEQFLKWRYGNWKIPRINKQPWQQDAEHLTPYL
jgi:phosphorylcholine metabolism protein LicD